MPDKPLALLLALTAGNAFAATSHFSDPVPEKADGVPLAYSLPPKVLHHIVSPCSHVSPSALLFV